jgi:hypothetical protein
MTEFLASSFYAHTLQQAESKLARLQRWNRGWVGRLNMGAHSWFETAGAKAVVFPVVGGFTFPFFFMLFCKIPRSPWYLGLGGALFGMVAVGFCLYAFIALSRVTPQIMEVLDGKVVEHPDLLPLVIGAAGVDGRIKERLAWFVMDSAAALDWARKLDENLARLCANLGLSAPAPLPERLLFEFYDRCETKTQKMAAAALAKTHRESPVGKALEEKASLYREKVVLEKKIPVARAPSSPARRI